MTRILDPHNPKNGFQQLSSIIVQIFFENELVNLSNKGTPINLKIKLDTNPQTSYSFFGFMDQRCIFEQRKAQSNAIVVKRQYLERAKDPQEIDSLLWINENL